MKLNKLHKPTDADILRNYIKDVRTLYESKITITIDDSDKKPGISIESRDNFVEKAKAVGNFNDEEWVNSLIRSMEQAGIQGFHKLCEDEKPVTNKQVQQLIGLLVDLVSSN